MTDYKKLIKLYSICLQKKDMPTIAQVATQKPDITVEECDSISYLIIKKDDKQSSLVADEVKERFGIDANYVIERTELIFEDKEKFKLRIFSRATYYGLFLSLSRNEKMLLSPNTDLKDILSCLKAGGVSKKREIKIIAAIMVKYFKTANSNSLTKTPWSDDSDHMRDFKINVLGKTPSYTNNQRKIMKKHKKSGLNPVLNLKPGLMQYYLNPVSKDKATFHNLDISALILDNGAVSLLNTKGQVLRTNEFGLDILKLGLFRNRWFGFGHKGYIVIFSEKFFSSEFGSLCQCRDFELIYSRINDVNKGAKEVLSVTKKYLKEYEISSNLDEGWVKLDKMGEYINKNIASNVPFNDFLKQTNSLALKFYVNTIYRDELHLKATQKFIKKSILGRIKFFYKIFLKKHNILGAKRNFEKLVGFSLDEFISLFHNVDNKE